MSEPTFEEMRPLLRPLAAIVAMHALIGRIHGTPAEPEEQRVMVAAISFADTLMAGLSADAAMVESELVPETIPLDYLAGDTTQDEAVKALARHSCYPVLPDHFKRLISRAVSAIQRHEDGIPF